jgi:hypothetical protein
MTATPHPRRPDRWIVDTPTGGRDILTRADVLLLAHLADGLDEHDTARHWFTALADIDGAT